MNYTTIPKSFFNIDFEIKMHTTSYELNPHISNSSHYYLNKAKKHLQKLQSNFDSDNCCSDLDFIHKIVNPFEFIHTVVPGSEISVSKVKPESQMFFELMEIFQICCINDCIEKQEKMSVAHLTNNHTSSSYLLNMIREENNDNIIEMNFDFNQIHEKYPKWEKQDLIICELNSDNFDSTYFASILLVLLLIVNKQNNSGIFILKVDNLFHKPLIDLVYILSNFYDKTCIVKPMISNITKGDRYIVCKGFDSTIASNIQNVLNSTFNEILHEIRFNNIYSIINNEIPYYVITKIDESNTTIAQQQLEYLDQVINIFRSKNKDEKIEHLKRNHILKCIQWCEKNQLPHNKFMDKINIFLK